MVITITELKKNTNKYLSLAQTEVVLITKYGKYIAQLSKPNNQKETLLSLVGIAKSETNISLDDIKEERLLKQ